MGKPPKPIKGTVSRDFRLLVFFMNQFLPSPWVYYLGRFEFFRNSRRYSKLKVPYRKLIHEKNQKKKISWHCPFNVPLVYMARDVRILIRADLLQEPIEGVGPENQDFFGNWHGNEQSGCHLMWPKKVKITHILHLYKFILGDHAWRNLPTSPPKLDRSMRIFLGLSC